jgi:hypothetical protein
LSQIYKRAKAAVTVSLKHALTIVGYEGVLIFNSYTRDRMHTPIIKTNNLIGPTIINFISLSVDRHCGSVVRVPGYRFRGPGSIPSATTFSEK